MFDELRQRIAKEMERDRAVLDRVRVKAGLLKLELRDKKDSVADGLQRAYDDAKQALADAKEATGERASELHESASEKWDAFKARLNAALD